MTGHQEAIEVLYRNLGAIPHEAYGSINIFPFAVESDQTNTLKRQVAEGIVQVLADAGFPMSRLEAPTVPTRDVTLSCRICSEPLMTVVVSEGTASVPAATVIATIASLDPECPHKTITIDDQRRKIEQAVMMGDQ